VFYKKGGFPMKKCVFVVLGVLCLLALLPDMASASATVWRFDFQPSNQTPSGGYVHVDGDTVYSAAQGYGFINDPCQIGSNQSAWRAGCNNMLVKGTVMLGDERNTFAVDLPNGDYYVTYVTGDCQYSAWQQPIVEGVTYQMSSGQVTPAGAPLYLVNVWGYNWNVGPVPPDREGPTGQIKTWGYQTEGSGKSEVLVLDTLQVTVTDGQLNVGGSGANMPMNYLIIVDTLPEPITNEPIRFDFEAPGTFPTHGYIHVDHTTVYSPALGYGFEDVNDVAQFGQDYIGHFEGETYAISNNSLIRDCVWWNFPWGMATFNVDLPNGDYLVTMGTGGVSYNRNHKPIVEGIIYEFEGGNFSPAGAPLYTLNVFQDNWDPNDLVETAYGNIFTYGHNQSNGDAEILYLERERVAVRDYQLNIGGRGSSDYQSLTFLEIVPATCEGLLNIVGKLAGDINEDCYVNLLDLAEIGAVWQECDGPADSNCTE
jgi:hypothetical protein